MRIFCLEKVKLPAEQEDWLKRPAYIKNNAAGVPICDNRCAIALYFFCLPNEAVGSQAAVSCIEGRNSSKRVCH